MPRLGPLVPGPLKPLARRLLRALRPATTDAPLAEADCRGELQAKHYAVVIEAGQAKPFAVRVTNLGPAAWSSRGTHPVTLQLAWMTSRKVPLDVRASSRDGSWSTSASTSRPGVAREARNAPARMLSVKRPMVAGVAKVAA